MVQIYYVSNTVFTCASSMQHVSDNDSTQLLIVGAHKHIILWPGGKFLEVL